MIVSVTCMRLLPSHSLHHVNIFMKLLHLKKQFIIYGPKYTLHQVKCCSLKLLNCILTVASVWFRPIPILLNCSAFLGLLILWKAMQCPGKNKYRNRNNITCVWFASIDGTTQSGGLWIIASGSLTHSQWAWIQLNEALNNGSFSCHC